MKRSGNGFAELAEKVINLGAIDSDREFFHSEWFQTLAAIAGYDSDPNLSFLEKNELRDLYENHTPAELSELTGYPIKYLYYIASQRLWHIGSAIKGRNK